jgi:hypothetical protein
MLLIVKSGKRFGGDGERKKNIYVYKAKIHCNLRNEYIVTVEKSSNNRKVDIQFREHEFLKWISFGTLKIKIFESQLIKKKLLTSN